MNKRGLGKGLDAFFPGYEESKDQESVVSVSITDIQPNPFQPRRVFDQDKLNELAQSITVYGVLQPIVVRKTLSGFQLVAGERRWRASQIAGITAISAVIRQYSDAEMTEIALIENVQRENLNPIEEAHAYRRLMDEFFLTQEEVARKIGKSRSWIANIVRLLNLPSSIQDNVSRETLSAGQVRPLLAIADDTIQLEIADQIIKHNLSARDVEDLVRKLTLGKTEKKERVMVQESNILEAEEQLKGYFGTKVIIKPGKNKSKIEIEYYSDEDLERILESLKVKTSNPSRVKSASKFVV